MNKYFLLIGLLLVLSSFAFADSITNYVVPISVPLNQPVTATGVFSDSNGVNGGKLCDFYFFDSTNNPVYRATAQYTATSGRFAMNGVVLVEPRFVRGQTYVLHSECGTASADANFSVDQKQEAFNVLGFAFYPQGGFLDLLYLRDNSLVLTMFFIVILFIAGVVILGWNNFFG